MLFDARTRICVVSVDSAGLDAQNEYLRVLLGGTTKPC